MTYIELINAFWDKRVVWPLSSCEADFYFYLLKECNSRRWTNPFKLPTQIIERDMNLNRRSICEIRNKLQQDGYIRFTSSARRGEVAEYEIVDISQDPYENANRTQTEHKPNANRTQTEHKPNANRTQSVTQTEHLLEEIEIEKEMSSDEDIKKVGRSVAEKRKSFNEDVSPYIPKYGQEMIDDFCEYWTKEVDTDILRFEKQEKFSIGGRLATWAKNNMSTHQSVTDIEEKTELYHIDWDKVKSWYNGLGLVMERWTEKRKRAYISIFDSYGGDRDLFREAIKRFGQEVKQSNWILGMAGSPMRDFEWLFTPINFTYVIDGKYRTNYNLEKNGATVRIDLKGAATVPRRNADDYDEKDD